MITKTTRITIETEAMFVVSRGPTVVAWCPECQAEVEVMLCEDNSVAQLVGGISAGSLHVWRPAGSSTRICLPSLLQLSGISEVQQLPFVSELKATKEKSNEPDG